MAGACGRTNRAHSKAMIFSLTSNRDPSAAFRTMADQTTDYRIVILGSAGVGKTNCVLRFVNGQYRDTYVPTVEDTYRQVVSCNKQITTLQITDTTGTHQFPAMQRLSIQKGHAFMLLYSITSKQTLEELKPIYHQIREIKGDQYGETPILLMGCKLDEAACREVTESIGKQLATLWSCAWIETSAKANLNIREAFQELLKLDKKRHFNFNVDQDGHPIDENGHMPSSPTMHGNKRVTTTNSNSSTTTNSGSSPNMTETTTTGAALTSHQATSPILRTNKSARSSVSSNSNAKKMTRIVFESNETNSRKAHSSSSTTTTTTTTTTNAELSANRNSNRKCAMM